MGMSLLEMTIFVMMGFTVNMVWLFCSVMFSKGMLHWNDPSKLLVTITVIQYCGLVMGILYGALWYWACSDVHHTTRGILSIRPA